jgi:hypothetical protein
MTDGCAKAADDQSALKIREILPVTTAAALGLLLFTVTSSRNRNRTVADALVEAFDLFVRTGCGLPVVH